MVDYHVPVMLQECLDGLNIQPGGTYVDVTFGGGGHSRAILEKLNGKGKLVAFDQDEEARHNLPEDKRLIFIDQNFRFLYNHLRYQDLIPVNGLLADLGVSSHQFDTDNRGFSFRFDDAELDMRMNPNDRLNAQTVLNTYAEADLASVFYLYGELPKARPMAKAIVTARAAHPIRTVGELKSVLTPFAPKFKDYPFWAQVFQAIRIEVNQELEVLKSLLLQCSEVIAEDGRLVIMSYHSLEDRLVKNFINTGNFDGEQEKDFYGNPLRPFEPIGKKAVQAGAQEQEINSRSRSAKLRVARRTAYHKKEEAPN